MTTLNEGVNEQASLTDAADLFLSRWADAEDKPSDTDKGETNDSEDTDEATVQAAVDDNTDSDEDIDLDDSDEADADQSTDDDANEDDSSAALEATDDHKVLLTVDGEEKTVTVKELKRLYGQEASLTRKSQEVAQARKEAETNGERYIAATQRLIEKAQARFKPFEELDWMVAQQRLEPEEFAALRKEARDAALDVQFLQSEANEVLKHAQEQRQAEFTKQAKAAIEVLERDVPGWNRNVYEQVCQFAVESGMAPETVAQITDPAAIKMFHKAMRLDALKAKAAQKKASKPQAAAPKRVVKPSASKPENIGSSKKATDGLQRLAQSGSRDDAAAAFLERWSDDNDA